ncbi:DUF5302 domain-containing protein [Streptomyces sp. NPDC000410]|uniref:DUF5302 domain-containing protein n=1 Tax=Streptomyces sp. NPDC000410 TaxID=3154254 RepID=UPI003321B19E
MTETPKSDRGEDELRAKFKEALERKSRTSQDRQAHEEGRIKVNRMSGPAGQKRNFRRKSG